MFAPNPLSRSLVRGICAFAAILAVSLPAAATSWKCVCTLHVTNAGFKWLTFHHSFAEFDLIGYSGASEKDASEKCGEVVAERHHRFEIGALLTLADEHILPAQKSQWKSKKTSLCREAQNVGTEKLDEETDWQLECRAYDSGGGKKEISGGIRVGSGHAVGTEITCGSDY